jgi:hypothetical protein
VFSDILAVWGWRKTRQINMNVMRINPIDVFDAVSSLTFMAQEKSITSVEMW